MKRGSVLGLFLLLVAAELGLTRDSEPCPPVCADPQCTSACLDVIGVVTSGFTKVPMPNSRVDLMESIQNAGGATAGKTVVTVRSDEQGIYELTAPSLGEYMLYAEDESTMGQTIPPRPFALDASLDPCPRDQNIALDCVSCIRPITLMRQGDRRWCCIKLDCIGQYPGENPGCTDITDINDDSKNCRAAPNTCTATGCAAREKACANRQTIKQAGCLLTCFAMLAEMNPYEMNRRFALRGFLGTQDIPDEEEGLDVGELNFEAARQLLGWRYTVNHDAYQDTAENRKQLKDELCLHPSRKAIAKVRSIGSSTRSHFVVITGVGRNPATGQCDFRIADPGAGHEFLGTYGRPKGVWVMR